MQPPMGGWLAAARTLFYPLRYASGMRGNMPALLNFHKSSYAPNVKLSQKFTKNGLFPHLLQLTSNYCPTQPHLLSLYRQIIV